MKAAMRVRLVAPVASFRHPFFVTGHQPTSLIPPPSTVAGLCAAATGVYPDPGSFWFGLHFTFGSRTTDLEHQHIASPLSPKTRVRVDTPFGEAQATTEIVVQPVEREFLHDVALTLYLPPDIGQAFRAPLHTMVLGRSQDLAEVVACEPVELARAERVRLEHTLLPFALRPCTRLGTTVLLSRWIEPAAEREATFERYVCLHDRLLLGENIDPTRAFVRVEGISLDDLWVDPSVVDDAGFARGVWLHRVCPD